MNEPAGPGAPHEARRFSRPKAELTCRCIEPSKYTSIEICAGAGGQALGIERAGFRHLALVENDSACCNTLRSIKAGRFGVHHAWKPVVEEISVKRFFAGDLEEPVDLYAGGVPCPPFSRAGRQLGADDDRDLFPTAVRQIKECEPRAVMLENVRGLMHERFDTYRQEVIVKPLEAAGYVCFSWQLLHAKTFGVPQLRPRALFVALRADEAKHFAWPDEEDHVDPPTVGQALVEEMGRRGWTGAREWAAKADTIAPTLVGGSKKHGGPDLGPTQARKQWEKLHVNGKLVALEPPDRKANGEPPILTVKMAAILQGFPVEWPFWGSKTAAYRQVGNAFPPPVAEAVAQRIAAALRAVDATPGAVGPHAAVHGATV
jgi:DNA (cytosine-5)-methyltransferase 1